MIYKIAFKLLFKAGKKLGKREAKHYINSRRKEVRRKQRSQK